ncbi:MAG: alpha/beta fold hydrolase [Myxococcota bacterium]
MRMEQPSTIPFLGQEGERGLALEGLYVPGSDDEPGVLVAPPHPLYGGSALNPVVTEIALRAQSLGMTSLRFNWRGVGASAGQASGEALDALADYRAALRFFEDCVGGAIVACGYSWGAVAAQRAAAESARVRKLVLVAPPASMLDADALEAFPGEVWIAVGENDELADPFALSRIAERAGAELVLLDDTDHFFGAGAAALGRAFEAWLR